MIRDPDGRGSASPDSSGASLHELLVWLALVAVVTGASAPDLVRWVQLKRLESAADRLAFLLIGIRAAATSEGRAHALALETVEGRLVWQRFVDGDGDGIGRADRERGIDRRAGPPGTLRFGHAGVVVGLPPGRRGPDGSGVPADGIAFGRSDLVVADPAGTTSSGTVYLSNRAGDSMAVRIYGPTGRISVWRHRRDDPGWRRSW